jgi:poly-gamma-glutamate synthesis protein (capsule biosynthesis protein)
MRRWLLSIVAILVIGGLTAIGLAYFELGVAYSRDGNEAGRDRNEDRSDVKPKSADEPKRDFQQRDMPNNAVNGVVLFLGGDVMTGRGIDQILPHAGDPVIYEPYMRTANGYVELAERVNGPINKPVGFSYIWGDALGELERVAPDARIINLETSITRSRDYWKGKGIHYRMQPANIRCLTAAGIDFCSLANNHVLDWGYDGLYETIRTLGKAKIKTAGAGDNLEEAEAPAVIDIREKGRVVVFAFGSATSGIPSDWAASRRKSGVNLLRDYSDETVEHIGELVRQVEREGDIVVASIHWGGNWGYSIPPEHRRFAHRLIDRAGIDVVHGHSSHHIRPIEVYKNRPIIYGCGDLLNDYEGISGYEQYRNDLTLMYFVTLESSSGALKEFRMIPMQIKRFQLSGASRADAAWLAETLNRESEQFGSRVILDEDNRLVLQWD